MHPHLLYCINILACTSTKNVNRILKLQKKAICIITKSNINEHTAPLFTNTKILPFDKLILQRKLLFMHAIHYNYALKSFADSFVDSRESWTAGTEVVAHRNANWIDRKGTRGSHLSPGSSTHRGAQRGRGGRRGRWPGKRGGYKPY